MFHPAFALGFKADHRGLAEEFIERAAFFLGKFPAFVGLLFLRLGEQSVKGAHAALEDHEFRAFLAEPLQFGSLEGGCLAQHPGNDPRLKRLVAVGGEWGVVHGMVIGYW